MSRRLFFAHDMIDLSGLKQPMRVASEDRFKRLPAPNCASKVLPLHFQFSGKTLQLRDEADALYGLIKQV